MIKYGVQETNPIPPGYHSVDRSTLVDWTDQRLARITRLRLVSDIGYPVWDVSYCHGVLQDGTECTVQVPFSQLPKHRKLRAIVNYAIADGVNAKKLGIFDAISTLV